MACCPAHKDAKPSLSVSEKDGKILVHCQVGCTTNEIVSAMGLSVKDLFLCPAQPKWVFIREHIYYDEAGNTPVAKKELYNKGDGTKTGVWYRYENGNYIKGLGGLQAPLFNLPLITSTTNDTIYIAEGEKDCNTLFDKMGYIATTSPNGAGSKWRSEYNQYIEGRDVVILADNDRAGQAHAEQTATALLTVAKSVKLIPAAAIYPKVKQKGDISDIAAEFGADTAKEMLDAAASVANVITEPITSGDDEPEDDTEGLCFIGEKQTNNVALQETLRELKPEIKYSWDDKGFGRMYADIFCDCCRYNKTGKQWYYYNGAVWIPDLEAMRAMHKAKELSDALLVYCTEITNETERVGFCKRVGTLGQRRYRETMLQDARDEYCFGREELDANTDLFNCQNGTLNLKIGEFKEHSPQELLSKISNVIYDPAARSPLFEEFISGIMLGNAAKIDYLQKIFGYSLTADTSLETCWILYGASARNGKSTLIETISYMMGGADGYAMSTQPQTLAQKQNKDTRQASGDIARLDGCRFLNASEPPKRMLFDAAQLKTLLGRDTITARHLMEREFEFIPHFKLFINTNFLPLIQDDSLFSSGRINVISFDRHFKPHEQDRELKGKLQTPENISGIFNWCLDGLKKFRESGAIPPEAVTVATDEYRTNSDKIGNFISECLAFTGKNSKAIDVYHRYMEWCTANGFGVENKANFFDELKSKGIFGKNRTVSGRTENNCVVGYVLYENDENPFNEPNASCY